jgi:hypothetical protein
MDQIREWRIPKSRVLRVFKDNCNRKGRGSMKPPRRNLLRLAKIARVLVRLDHVARIIVNANHSIV